MAGETSNIMQMAEMVSKDIFQFFGWKMAGTSNENFQCLKTDSHQMKSRHPYHPCDAVFTYAEPYFKEDTYLLVDFKSYSSSSIESIDLRKPLSDLAKAVDCARVSDEFKKRHINSDSYEINGLLFIFNHDGNLDTKFDEIYSKKAPHQFKISDRVRIYVMGPDRIAYLLCVINDCRTLSGIGELPQAMVPQFAYPDRVKHYSRSHRQAVASIESLLGPWLIIPFDFTNSNGKALKGYKIYIDSKGETEEEFMLLFDYCFRNQLVEDGYAIEFRIPYAVPHFRKNFQNAQENFLQSLWGLKDIKNRLDQFSVNSVPDIVRSYASVEIGMGRRDVQK